MCSVLENIPVPLERICHLLLDDSSLHLLGLLIYCILFLVLLCMCVCSTSLVVFYLIVLCIIESRILMASFVILGLCTLWLLVVCVFSFLYSFNGFACY